MGGFLLTISLFGAWGCTSRPSAPPPPTKVFVSCAASLSGAVEETARTESVPIALNSGGSNALVRQAVLGARVDLLLLADDQLAKKELVPKGYTLTPLASNELVVIAHASTGGRPEPMQSFPQSLAGTATLAVADASTAPLGAYTDEALQGVALKAKRIPLQDAQAVVSAVALGHAEQGIVYRSDAQGGQDVRTVCPIPTDRHRRVIYVAATPHPLTPQAERLLQSLLRGQGRQILERHGFAPPPAPAATSKPPRR